MKAAEGITGCIHTMDASRLHVAGNLPQWALHHVQHNLGGQGYHVHNGAMGEAYVTSTLWLSWLFFCQQNVFGVIFCYKLDFSSDFFAYYIVHHSDDGGTI